MYYDITQEVFSCKVYPGDSPPSFRRAQDMARGDACTVTDITMCAHNGTHVDAPAHYIRGGKTAEELELSRFAGRCAVRSFAGRICAEELQNITAPRLLIKGEREITPEEAALLGEKFLLVGVETQSVGPDEAHRVLLGKGVALLEGVRLSGIAEGEYELFAFPLKLGGCDGAPVRAVLRTKEEKE